MHAAHIAPVDTNLLSSEYPCAERPAHREEVYRWELNPTPDQNHLQQPGGGLDAPGPRAAVEQQRQRQWGAAPGGLRVGVGAGVQQQADGAHVAGEARPVQRCVPAASQHLETSERQSARDRQLTSAGPNWVSRAVKAQVSRAVAAYRPVCFAWSSASAW